METMELQYRLNSKLMAVGFCKALKALDIPYVDPERHIDNTTGKAYWIVQYDIPDDYADIEMMEEDF